MTTDPTQPDPDPKVPEDHEIETELPAEAALESTLLREMDSSSMAPRSIGPYKISAIIGQGGMGTVYKAMQESPRRAVALKVMKRGVTSRSARKRFEYEAQTLGRLRHENIAQIYEAGTHDGKEASQPYFAMEYIPNARSITEYAEHKNLGTRERLALFAKVCEAIQHGHQKGIIHRDIKPGNILVTSNGIPKVIDFGVARSTDSDMAITTMRTDLGQLIGTLQYMSPEQCDADPDDIDTRSDVYALGMVLYELLTGSPPYDIRNAAIHEAIRVIREEEPTRLSSMNRSLRGDIETMTLKALQKNRAVRYQSATELSQDIFRYLHDEPISARPPGMVDKIRRFIRKRKAFATSAALILLTLSVSSIVIGIYAAEKNRREREAIMLEESSEQILRMAGHLTEQVGVTDYMSPTMIERVALLNSLDYKVERLYIDVLEMMKTTLGEEHPHTIQAMMNLGYLHSLNEDYDKADQQYTIALDTSRRIRDEDHPETIEIIKQVGILSMITDKYSKSNRLLTEALDRSRRVFGEDHEYTNGIVLNMGTMYYKQKDYEAALACFLECLEVARQHDVDKNEHAVIDLSIGTGELYQLMERYAEARPHYLFALDTHKQLFGTDNNGYLIKLEHLISLHHDWHKAEPNAGHDATAAEYQTKLDGINQWLNEKAKR